MQQYGRTNRDKTKIVKVDEVFLGEDCCEQFVCFLINNRFYQHTTRKESGCHANGKITNYIFAHNGMKFDIRFIIDKIFSLLGGPTILGDMNTLKAFKVKGITFLDTCLVIPQPLKEMNQGTNLRWIQKTQNLRNKCTMRRKMTKTGF